MITITDRTMKISDEEKLIGFEGDNLIEVRQFEVTETSLFDFDFKLDLKNREYTDIIDLAKTVEDDKIILTWTITRENLVHDGRLYAQLRAFSGNDEVWHSNVDYFSVKNSLNVEDYYPEILPSEFSQMESRVTAIQTDVTEKAAEVEEDRAEVAANTETVNVKTEEVIQSAINAKTSEQKAKASEDNAKDSEVEAGKSEDIATRAMLDLLAMLGVDIATLTGGKLTPSQIPAIAITDTFVVADEAAMLALECETGDIAIRTDETKSYILQGTDPSILINWQILKSPTNFADEAGHAATADEAENANKINDHRIVAFKSDETSTGQEKYDNAVIDTETIYFASSEVI